MSTIDFTGSPFRGWYMLCCFDEARQDPGAWAGTVITILCIQVLIYCTNRYNAASN